MRLRTLLTYICVLIIAINASASPARKGVIMLTQPDGTAFGAILQGDEFVKIKTTTTGHAIIQGEDGWWCYAIYTDDGSRQSSGWKIGQETPQSILSESLYIPRKTITENGIKKRQSANIKSALSGFANSPSQSQTISEQHGIVILAQFKDVKFAYKTDDFRSMLNNKGYSKYGATGSAKDYFESQFRNNTSFIFDVAEIVTLPAKREYYGENDRNGDDRRPEYMVSDACTLAAQNGVDFAKYDLDNDGKVDNVFVFFAGEDEAEGADETSIWSHSWHLFSGAGLTLELNGKLIDRYACASEMARIYDTDGRLLDTRLSGIGTFCHEYSHTLGLPDLYDTDYEDLDGWAAGLWGSTALMDAGNQNNNGNTPPNFNALERELLGISVPTLIEHDGKYTLSPIQVSGESYRLNTDRADEYYLIECRSSNSDTWDKYIGGSGMLVYHIDRTRSVIDKWDIDNTVNSNANHQCADLIEADGRSDSYSDYMDYLTRSESIKGIFFPYNKTNSILPKGTPGLNYWSGGSGEISITNIQIDKDGTVNFNIVGFSKESTPPSVYGDIQYEVFPDGAILKFEADKPFQGNALISYNASGEDVTEVTVAPYEEGKYAVMLNNLEPVKTYDVSICFTVNDINGTAKKVSFMTKKKPIVEWPYISFGSAKRNNDGTFTESSRIPLKINNSKDIKDISWSFDGESITHDGDHYFTLNMGGILQAHIYMTDGTEVILVKQIITSAK